MPYLFPHSGETPKQTLLRRILTAEQTQLCIYAPTTESAEAWLAVRLQSGDLALLASLPRICRTEPSLPV